MIACVTFVSEDLRNWFVRQEVGLFKYRYLTEEEGSKKEFVNSINLDLKPASARRTVSG